MATRHRSPDELLRAVEQHQEQYLRSLRALHESMFAVRQRTNSGGPRMERTGSNDIASGSPTLAAAHGPPSPLPPPAHTSTGLSTSSLQSGGHKRGRRRTNELGDPAMALAAVGEKKNIPVSLYEADSDVDDDDVAFIPLLPPSQSTAIPEYKVPSVQRPLPAYALTEEDLDLHFDHIEISPQTEIWRKRQDMAMPDVFRDLSLHSDDADLYKNATYEVYDVGREAFPKALHDNRGNADNEALEARDVWNTLKEVNTHGDAVGRMTILQEPSPAILGIAHATLSRHFDMNELYQHLITTEGNKGRTKAYMHRLFEPDRIKRQTFFFVFKYYTVVSPGAAPSPWQHYDYRPPDRKSIDHIDIAECSSVLALALIGPTIKEIHLRSRKRKPVQIGHVSDPFAPWHLLNIQCFPDDRHSIRVEDANRPLYSGPYAFLDALASEYKDAVKRNLQLNELITGLITPPNQFIFDVKLRDKLLFEDKDFTYSRRYFWAYNSLGVINDGIKAMRDAYNDTFNDDFWTGRHQTLWPLLELNSTESLNYLDKLSSLRYELNKAVEDLEKVQFKNERLRKEIMSLREQLFSGSSVKESRRAIEQGDNIKILTMISMIFLPLTFVTSVFGITEFHYSAEDWRFPVVMVCVCVPFFVFVVLLQTRAGMGALKRVGHAFDGLFTGDRVRNRRERRMQQLALEAQQTQAAQSKDDVASIRAGRRRASVFRARYPRRGRRGASAGAGAGGGADEGRSVRGSSVKRWWRWSRQGREKMRAMEEGGV